MKSIIDTSTREKFYIRLYFNIKDGYELAGVRRAYLDFSRTLHKKNETDEQRKKKRTETELFIEKRLKNIIYSSLRGQSVFDKKHKELTLHLVRYWNKLTIGQAQKWINMSLKYWLLFGHNRIPNIEKNAKYFHIPIDGIIQEKMFPELEYSAWSKIKTYDEYFKYQISFREKSDKIPIVAEFEEFNNS